MRLIESADTRILDERQRSAVETLFDAILPGGDTQPGAADAGAAEFLDRQLAADGDDAYFEVPSWRRLYERGLAVLETASLERTGRPVAELTRAEATDLLAELARGDLEAVAGDLDQRAFFSTLRAHCIEGCFSDPRWGGNRDAVMWRWIGYLEPARAFERDGGGVLAEVSPDRDRRA